MGFTKMSSELVTKMFNQQHISHKQKLSLHPPHEYVRSDVNSESWYQILPKLSYFWPIVGITIVILVAILLGSIGYWLFFRQTEPDLASATGGESSAATGGNTEKKTIRRLIPVL